MTDSVDLLISGGTIVDGTGSPGGVARSSSRVTARILASDAELPAHAATTIDATGRVVAPGFIDLHSHGGLVILAEPGIEPKVRRGVTTEIVGVDGNGFAPFRVARTSRRSSISTRGWMAGRHRLRLAHGRRLPQGLRRHGESQHRDVGRQQPAADRRLGWDDVPADGAAIDRMAGTLCDAMAEGAVGFSSGLDYLPGSHDDREELAALTSVAGEAGGFYHTHVRYPLGDRYLDPFREAIDIGRRAAAPSHITHFYHRETHPGGPGDPLAFVDDARAEGLDITLTSLRTSGRAPDCSSSCRSGSVRGPDRTQGADRGTDRA